MIEGSTLSRARSVERAVNGLRGIRKARVEIAPNGEVSVEVLAVPERSASVLRRQVVAAVRATLGATAPTQAIHLQIAGRNGQVGTKHSRRKLTSLITRRTHDRFSTQVLLTNAGDIATGEAECSIATRRRHAVAEAVLDGLHEVSARPLELRDVEVVPLGDRTVAMVAVTCGDRALLGTAEVQFDLPEAVARATLHAVNRSLGHPL